MKDIKDYLHLYLGCEVHDFVNDKVGRLFRVSTNGVCKVLHSVQWSLHPHEFKLILRPLSVMTEEEAVFIKRVLRDNHGIDTIKTVLQNGWHLGHISANASQMFEITRYLLSKSFDLFRLIEAGLAIDATKQPNP